MRFSSWVPLLASVAVSTAYKAADTCDTDYLAELGFQNLRASIAAGNTTTGSTCTLETASVRKEWLVASSTR